VPRIGEGGHLPHPDAEGGVLIPSRQGASE